MTRAEGYVRMEQTFNWYIILDLSFDPPIEDETIIKNQIVKMDKFWISNFNDYKKGAQYRTWHDNLRQIERDMIGPNNIRKELISQACNEVYGPIDEMLKTIARKGSITNQEIEKIAQLKKTSIEVVNSRVERLGIKKEIISTIDHQSIVDMYYGNKPQSVNNYEGQKDMLSAFQVDNLYEFLDKNIDAMNADAISCDRLLQLVEEKKKNFIKSDSRSGNGKKLCVVCEKVFADRTTRKEYDDYLRWKSCRELLDMLHDIAEVTDWKIDQIQYQEYAKKLECIYKNQVLASNILISFCKVERIVIVQKEPPKDIAELPAVANFKVVPNAAARANLISWTAVSDQSVTYILVRSLNNSVEYIEEGNSIIFKGKASSYVDNQIQPGKVYYYNVFYRRNNQYSCGVKEDIKPIINFYEVKNVSVTAGDSYIDISIHEKPVSAIAEIYVINDSKEQYIDTIEGDTCQINGLPNGKDYSVRVVLVYTVGGVKHMTKGVVSPTVHLGKKVVNGNDNNNIAILALVLALLGVFDYGVLSIIGLSLGIKTLKTPYRKTAIAAIVISIIIIVLSIMFIVYMIYMFG